MNIEEVRSYALSLPGVTEDQPFGEDNVTFRVEAKSSCAFGWVKRDKTGRAGHALPANCLPSETRRCACSMRR